MERPIATPVEGDVLRRFMLGFGYPLRGARLVLSHRGLLVLSAAPILITTILYGAGLYLFFGHLTDVVNAIWAQPEVESWWQWLLLGLWYLLYPIAVLLALAVVYFSIIVVANVVATPFNEVISEKVEGLARGREVGPPFSWAGFLGDVARGLVHTLKRLLLLAAIMVPIVLVGLVGLAPVSAVVGTAVASLFLALEYLDPAMSRARIPFRDKRRLVLDNLPLCLGFGAAVYVLLIVPFVAIFCIPPCVAGATLLYVGVRPGE